MAQRKIVVKICVGTACFVQGGADLLLYEDFLEPSLLERCVIEGTGCLGGCKVQDAKSGAPFVEVDGNVHANVTVDRLRQLIKEAIDA